MQLSQVSMTHRRGQCGGFCFDADDVVSLISIWILNIRSIDLQIFFTWIVLWFMNHDRFKFEFNIPIFSGAIHSLFLHFHFQPIPIADYTTICSTIHHNSSIHSFLQLHVLWTWIGCSVFTDCVETDCLDSVEQMGMNEGICDVFLVHHQHHLSHFEIINSKNQTWFSRLWFLSMFCFKSQDERR